MWSNLYQMSLCMWRLMLATFSHITQLTWPERTLDLNLKLSIIYCMCLNGFWTLMVIDTPLDFYLAFIKFKEC